MPKPIPLKRTNESDLSPSFHENAEKLSTYDLIPGLDAIAWRANSDFTKMTFVSEQAFRITGYPVSRWLGEPNFWKDHMNPFHHQEWLKEIENTTVRQSRLRFEHQAKSSSGENLWFRTSMHVARNSKDEIQSLFGLSIDVTDYRRTELKLERSLRDLEEIKYALDQTAVVAITDTNGIITYVNDNFCELSGYSRDEIIGQTHRIFKSGSHSKEFYQSIWSTISQGRIWRGEIHNRKKDGSTYWSFMTIAPFINNLDKPYQYVAIRTDITALKKAEEEHVRLLEAETARNIAQEAVQSRDRFVSMAAHELKTPITSLQLLLEMLLKQCKAENFETNNLAQLTQMLESAAFQTNRLTTLINDMLDVARISAGKLKLDMSKVNLTEIMTQLLKHFQQDFRLAKCEVTLDAKEPIVGSLDKARIEQVIINLLTNAMKYGKGCLIEISVSKRENLAEIHVTDHGMGIPKEFLERIFDRFERSNVSERLQGLGLGLWISKQIVDAHNGDITVTSELGKGSTFIISLPLQPQEGAHIQ